MNFFFSNHFFVVVVDVGMNTEFYWLLCVCSDPQVQHCVHAIPFCNNYFVGDTDRNHQQSEISTEARKIPKTNEQTTNNKHIK